MNLTGVIIGFYAGIAIVAYVGTRLALIWRARQDRRRLRELDWRYR